MTDNNKSRAWHSALDAVKKMRRSTICNPDKWLPSHNLYLPAGRTSVRLDEFTWKILKEVAQLEGVTIHQLCGGIQQTKPAPLSFTVAIRCYLLEYFCRKARRGRR
jgi:predicted DNA-binding ribbon-helix-helix protein